MFRTVFFAAAALFSSAAFAGPFDGPVTVVWSLDRAETHADLRAADQLARRQGMQVTAINVDAPDQRAAAEAFLAREGIGLSYNHGQSGAPLWTMVAHGPEAAPERGYAIALPALQPGAVDAAVVARKTRFDDAMNAY